MTLVDAQIRQAKPQDKDVWLTDEKGLRLLIKPNGSKYWRLKYRYLGKQKTLALGVYPTITLKVAREAAGDARRKLAGGVDPGQLKKREKQQRLLDSDNTFAVLAWEWHQQQRGTAGFESQPPVAGPRTCARSRQGLRQGARPSHGDASGLHARSR